MLLFVFRIKNTPMTKNYSPSQGVMKLRKQELSTPALKMLL